jgi:hypothetical protein
MTASDVAAIVGAAAWIPIIVQLIFKALKKPKLEIISAPNILLGYTSLGPFLQLTASISSRNRDVIVINMAVRVIHNQSKEERLLTWTSVTEDFFNLLATTDESLRMNKTQSVLAIKAITETLTERHIAFTDLPFAAVAQGKVNSAREQFMFLSNQGKGTSEELSLTKEKEWLRTKEFEQAKQLLTDSIFWREGSYSLEVKVYGKQIKTPHREVFEVNLTRPEIEELRKNLDLVFRELQDQVTGNDKVRREWKFVQTAIRPLSKIR